MALVRINELCQFDQEGSQFVCEICGYRHRSQNGVELHARKAHGWKGKSAPAGSGPTGKKQPPAQECPTCQGTIWRLLDPQRSAEERAAYAAGFRHYCAKCSELRK